MAMAHAGPGVAVYVASLNTAHATELCIRTMREYASYPFRLTVGDSGSTDGTLEMLSDFRERGWLDHESQPGWHHWQWLEHWRHQRNEPYAVFVDSDVQFRRRGWLRQLVECAVLSRSAVVAATIEQEVHGFTHETLHKPIVRLARRPSAHLLLIETARMPPVVNLFAGRTLEAPALPEGFIHYDVGGWLLEELEQRRVPWSVMPWLYRFSYRHYGGLSWVPGTSGVLARQKRRELQIAACRLQRAQARQDRLPDARLSPVTLTLVECFTVGRRRPRSPSRAECSPLALSQSLE
jgi:Glycosyl transferase family 2